MSSDNTPRPVESAADGENSGAGNFVIALSTFPDAETATKIARKLVEEALVACANILPGTKSIYFWQGKVEEGAEVLVIFKLTAGRFDEFQIRLSEMHPYDVPEILQFKVAEGPAPYLRWIAETCARK